MQLRPRHQRESRTQGYQLDRHQSGPVVFGLLGETENNRGTPVTVWTEHLNEAPRPAYHARTL